MEDQSNAQDYINEQDKEILAISTKANEPTSEKSNEFWSSKEAQEKY